MDPGASNPFSTGGRFVPRSSPPQTLYPTGALVPTSIGRVYGRQSSLDDRSRYGNSLLTDDTDRVRSPVLRELQKYRQLADSGVAAAPSSATLNVGLPRARMSSGAEGVTGGVLKWIENGWSPSVEASASKRPPQGVTAANVLGQSGGAISIGGEAASPGAKDNRRYLSRRVVGRESIFDAGAPAVPFVLSSANLAVDHPDSFEDRFERWMPTGGAAQPAHRQQALAPPGLFASEPAVSKVVPPSVFGIPDRAGGRSSLASDRESDGPQGTGIPLLDEYIRYLNREYGA